MLSVLSSGTLQLSEELCQAREEAHRLISERQEALVVLRRSKAHFQTQIGNVSRLFEVRDSFNLKRTAFLGFLGLRAHVQLLPFRRKCDVAETSRRSAWVWLWRKKVLCLWHRATSLSYREQMLAAHIQEVAACREQQDRISGHLSAARADAKHLEKMLSCERQRANQLEADLAKAKVQISDLKATLKDAYVRQFEESQQRQTMEEKLSSVVGEMRQMRKDRDDLLDVVEQKRKEIAESEDLHQLRELRLHEASGELSLAEVVIDDITSSKWTGMQRFFEKHDLTGVLAALFRKLIELHGSLRIRQAGGLSRQPSLTSIGSPRSPHPSSPTASPKGTKTAAVSLAAEVRNALSLHKEGTFSKHALLAYIESFHLTQVSAPMVVQVLLAILDVDLADGRCDVSRFIAALNSPPAWGTTHLAKDLWGSLGESAANIVQATRRRSKVRTRTDCSPAAEGRMWKSAPAAAGRQRSSRRADLL